MSGTRRLDVTRSGSQSYTDEERAEFVAFFRVLAKPMTVADMSDTTGIDGRRIRAILSDADGDEILMAGGPDGLMPAKSREDAERMTARLSAQARAMGRRVARRVNLTPSLEPDQGSLPLDERGKP